MPQTPYRPEALSDSRPLGEQERIFNYLHDFGALIPVQVLHVRGPLDATKLRAALDQVQSGHPLLQSHVVRGEFVFRSRPPFLYRQPHFNRSGTTEIPLRIVDATDDLAWQATMEEEFSLPLGRGLVPRLRCTWVRPRSADGLHRILLTADHAVADATATNLISQEILLALAGMLGPKDQSPLPAPLEAQLVKSSDPGARYEPACRFTTSPDLGARGTTRICRATIASADVRQMREATNSNGTTVNGLVTAAFLLALKERTRQPRLSVLSAVDMRRLSKPPVPTDIYGCFIDIVRTQHEMKEGIWALARDVSFGLLRTLARRQEQASILSLPGWEVYHSEFVPILKYGRRIDALAVSSIGESHLQRAYGEFTLEEVTMGVSLATLGPSLFVITCEWMGSLQLHVAYYDKAMSPTAVSQIVGRVLALLDRGCGLSSN